MAKLNDIDIRRWIKAGKPVAKSDGGGLTFTLSSKGMACWVLRYRFGGTLREMTIGRYQDISLANARKLAIEARAKIQGGVDVAREKRRVKVETAAAMSFRKLAADYMEKTFPRLAASTAKQRRYHIERILLPKLGGLAARDVSAADVIALIESVGARSKSVAELVFTAISEIFKHGIARHAVTGNPCAVLSVSAIIGRAEPKRQRLKLTADELRAIMQELPAIGVENTLAFKILLTTCVRISELTQAKWEHIDFEKTEWFVPDANSKTRKGFTVPLTAAVIGWFKELETLACGSSYVLPARQAARLHKHGGDIHIDQRTINAILHKLYDILGDRCRRFTPHDLRSTARSHLSALGVDLIVAERCLNHTLGGLIATYDKHDYLDERRVALGLWTDFILDCKAGEDRKVVPLQKRTGALT